MRRRSSGWTSTIRYTLLMSTLARRALRPVLTTALAASSTEMYDSERSSGEMAIVNATALGGGEVED